MKKLSVFKKKATIASSHTRAQFRFKSNPLHIAWVDLTLENDDFAPGMVGLILNESFHGCSLITYDLHGLKENLACRVQLGDAEPLDAKVRWIKKMDDNLIRIGFEFVD